VPREIRVELPRNAFYTSEVVEGAVVVEVTNEVASRGLYLDFRGREETEITRGSGKQQHTYRSHVDHVHWRLPLQGEGRVPPGQHRIPFRFQIPEWALPSYEGRHAWVRYKLTARLDVPLWLDTMWDGEIFVFYDRGAVRYFAQPVRFRSGGEGPEVYVELDGDRFFARELIGCRITLARLGERRLRRVYARLIGGEWARADSQEEMTEMFRNEVEVPADRIRVGVPFEVEIPIPGDVQSSYHGKLSYYSFVVQVGLDLAWASDVIAQTPIVVVR